MVLAHEREKILNVRTSEIQSHDYRQHVTPRYGNIAWMWVQIRLTVRLISGLGRQRV